MIITLLCVLPLLLLPANQVDASKALELRLNVRVCGAPCNLRIIARVDPHPDNRLLSLIVDGPDYYSSHDIPLEGDTAPITQRDVWFPGLPVGDYTIEGIVTRANAKPIRTVSSVEVH